MVKHGYAPEWSYEETKLLIMSIQSINLRRFCGITYVLGARLNEARMLRPKDIQLTKNKNGEERLIVSLFTLKNRHIEYRHIPINPFAEPEYASMLLNFKQSYEENERGFQRFNERTIQNHVRKTLDIHVHALRHLRVHHVDDQSIPQMKALTPRQFKDYFGWELIETSAHYQSRTRAKDILELV